MSQRSMVPVLIFGGLVLAAGAGLWLMLRSGDEPSSEGASNAVTEPAATQPTPARPESAPTVTPSLTAEPPRAPAGEAVKEYVVGDRRIRDHRSGERAPIDIPPAVHPPDSRKIKSNLTHDIGQKLKVIVKDCALALPAGAKTGDPRLEGKIVIAIKAKQVTVTNAVVQLRDVEDASVEAVKKCIEDKSLAVTHVAEEDDLESYDINLSYSL